MAAEPISRPEFDSAIAGIQRELRTMGDNIGSNLIEIRSLVMAHLDMHRQEERGFGVLSEKVDANEKAIEVLHALRRTEKNNRWIMWTALAAAILGHFLPILTKH